MSILTPGNLPQPPVEINRVPLIVPLPGGIDNYVVHGVMISFKNQIEQPPRLHPAEAMTTADVLAHFVQQVRAGCVQQATILDNGTQVWGPLQRLRLRVAPAQARANGAPPEPTERRIITLGD